MSYLVLARKYRPKTFVEMVGQEHVVQALTNALTQQRLHHAYLFTGTRGVGKTTVSRILAKSLNCQGADGQGGITATPCGVCQACTDIDSGRFVDYTELDAASNRGVDEVQGLLEQAVYKPVQGRFKVFMIDEVHMLTNTAFNAMLKTLEEPPEYLKFVLATTARDRTMSLPVMEVREAMGELATRAAHGEKCGILFGPERTGLTNEELELCQYLVTIPANPQYSSLNLASAVQVLSYELRVEALRRVGMPAGGDAHVPAPNEQLERYFAHLQQVLDLIGFFGDRESTKIMRRLRRLYQRGMPDERELQILRGILTETEISVRGRKPRA